jgi:outer membrane protein assembly factor BamB
MPRLTNHVLVPRLSGAVAAALVVTGLAAPPLRAADWPQWRGPNRDALSAETGLLREWKPGGPPLAWKATGLGVGFSSVAVVGGRIYTLGDKDGAQQVIALDRADGKPAWMAKLGPPWKDEMGGPRGTPTVDGDLLYAIGTEGDLVCVEAATGKERWRKSLTKDFGGQMMSGWKFSESPLVDGDKLVFTPGAKGAALVAVDKKTGKEIWRAAVPDLGPKGKDGAGYSSVVVSEGAGVRQYVQLLGRGLVGVRAADGKFLWSYNNVANQVANISTPVVKGDLVFASTGYQTGSALVKLQKAGDGIEAREVYFLDAKTLQNHHGGLVLVGDYLYAGHGQGRGSPICVELATGKVMWGGEGAKAAGTGSAAVMYADGNLYFRYQNGVVALIKATPTGYKEKGTFTIPDVKEPSWPHLVVSEGKLYVREQDALYCYDLHAGEKRSGS